MVAVVGGAKVAGASSVDATDPKQPLITSSFSPKTREWKKKLMRWIVRTAQACRLVYSLIYA